MERSTYPKNLSSSCKRAIQDLLHGQNPTKKLRHLFDAHSQAGDNTGQHLFAEDLIISVLRSSTNTLSESMSAESSDFLQFPTDACVWSKESDEESVNTPVGRITSPTCTEVSSQLDDMYSWRKYGKKTLPGAKFPRGYYRCIYRNIQGCLATKQVQRMSDNPSFVKVTYRGRHTCNAPHPQKPPLILDSPCTGDNPFCHFLHQPHSQARQQQPFSSSTFSLMKHEQKLPGEDELTPCGGGHNDESSNNNQSTSSDYCAGI